jgi:UDP-glucose 4-epimerase
VSDLLSGKTVLVTGGTGSFGHVVVQHLLKTPIEEIRVFSRDEKKQEDMRNKLKSDRVKFYIGDVRDYRSIKQALTDVDFVFSAAALKQVPSCEFHPMEAVKTNVLGSENLLEAALEVGVKRVVVLSTDKAVYPINAMGMSKALMEKIMVAKSRQVGQKETVFSATRYGNVLASRGSVIPLFVKQIKEKKPITITDPSMTRFLMNLDEAIDLVIYAFMNGVGGDIFVQKSSAATILDLAVATKEIFNAEVEIKIIGTRHGEKKHETLLNREERARSKDLGRYFQIMPDERNLNYEAYFTDGKEMITSSEDYTSETTDRLSVERLKSLLINLDFIKKELNQ